eukprot:jgi/Ulvmu1/11963/UM082_0042.1
MRCGSQPSGTARKPASGTADHAVPAAGRGRSTQGGACKAQANVVCVPSLLQGWLQCPGSLPQPHGRDPVVLISLPVPSANERLAVPSASLWLNFPWRHGSMHCLRLSDFINMLNNHRWATIWYDEHENCGGHGYGSCEDVYMMQHVSTA